MEWALCVPNLEKVYLIKEPWKDNDVFSSAAIKNISEEAFGEICFSRIYYGQGFCERAIPSLHEVLEIYHLTQENSQEMTLVTPYVTDHGLLKLRDLFQGLAEKGLELEVVVNDWGILYLLNHEFPSFKPIIGRQLNKAWRDPRIGNSAGKQKKKFPNLKLDSLPSTSFESDIIRNFFKEFGTSHVELDIMPWGFKNFSKGNYEVSLYFPYTIVTSGRMCLLNSWGQKKEDKFKTLDNSCKHLCRKYWLELSDKSGQVLEIKERKIIQKGNALFCVFSADFLKDVFNDISETGINRMIFQPEPI
ncbi:hypothetical protein Desaci_1112 [Desulfosporosinus acidiphilus SJ4]|uniref:Collagenase-like protease n=1 Tax=Desulfosporosinus acidiphilus (strain DSM 22704 / JCM 16185 / SJ4) TaxID=646529 RepID=I4D2X5_DESAJ|nr:hypothetical protein [Desulfosporosinus acidiphilus]AFM40149.1 hypothetical protein Desaci_1112 [Desulfosporosinus acidiphilus SJ4]